MLGQTSCNGTYQNLDNSENIDTALKEKWHNPNEAQELSLNPKKINLIKISLHEWQTADFFY